MKCRWCDWTFLRGGPNRSLERLKDHVEDTHPDEARAAGLLDASGHLHPDFGQGWATQEDYDAWEQKHPQVRA